MTQTSIIEWHEWEKGTLYPTSEYVLVALANGQTEPAYFDTTFLGWAYADGRRMYVDVVAWAHLPKYDRVLASSERSSVVNAEIWRAMADA